MLGVEGALSDISEFGVEGVSRVDSGKRVTQLGVELGGNKQFGLL